MNESLAAWSTFATAAATVLLVVATFLTAHRTKTRLDEIQALSAVIPTLPVDDPLREKFTQQRTELTKLYFERRTRAQAIRDVAGPIAVLLGLAILFLGMFKIVPIEVGLGSMFVVTSVLFLTGDFPSPGLRFPPR